MTWDIRTGIENKVIVVTGAGGAIGGAVATAIAEAGGQVLGVDLIKSNVAKTIAALPGPGHSHLHADIANLSTHSEIFWAAKQLGPLRGLAHVAAILLRQNNIDEVTEADWDIQQTVNLKSTFFLNRATRNALLAAGLPGSIVNFASQGWWTGGMGGSVVYAASKGGVVSLTRGLARTFAAENIRVNAVSPGGVDTAMMNTGLSPEIKTTFLAGVPMARLAKPSELTGAVLYLLSDSSSFVTGTVLNVSGGQLMY